MQNRRNFLTTLVATSASVAFASVLKTTKVLAAIRPERIPVMQGTTSDTATWLVYLTPSDFPVQATLRSPDGLELSPTRVSSVLSPSGVDTVNKVLFEGLSPGKDFTLELKDSNGAVVNTRTLRTLDLSKPNPRIAFLSCIDHTNSDKLRDFWRGFAANAPDAIFMSGDNVYADLPGDGKDVETEQEFWDIYGISWRDVEFYRLPRLIPVFATWDDHDYGMNNGDSSYHLKDASKKIFDAFYGTEIFPGMTNKGPGVSSLVTISGVDYFLLDNRYFRTPLGTLAEEETQWGSEQENWMFNHLRSNRRPAVLISGSQYFGAYLPKESYEKNHPTSFKNILRKLKETGAAVAFVSGDRHFTEFQRLEKNILGYPTFEITSSGMQSSPLPVSPWLIYRNRRQIAGVGTRHSYVISEVKVMGRGASFLSTTYSPNNRTEFQHELKIDA